MARCWLPTGKPEFIKWKETTVSHKTIKKILPHPFYFIKVKIISIRKKLCFPLQSKINEGVRTFTNDIIGDIIYMDKIALEDFLKFQQAKVELIEGYYFSTGSDKIQNVITDMFNLRLHFKKENNDPAQKLVKLMLNSCYGKTALKHSNTTKRIIENKDIDKFTQRHYREINKIIQLKNGLHIVDINNNKLAHFNRVHCGATILSMSKRIMNEVITLADGKIYYQDTDSLHIKEEDIEVLEKDFKKKYK